VHWCKRVKVCVYGCPSQTQSDTLHFQDRATHRTYCLSVSRLLLVAGAGRSVAYLTPQLFDEFRVLLLHLLSELLTSATQKHPSTPPKSSTCSFKYKPWAQVRTPGSVLTDPQLLELLEPLEPLEPQGLLELRGPRRRLQLLPSRRTLRTSSPTCWETKRRQGVNLEKQRGRSSDCQTETDLQLLDLRVVHQTRRLRTESNRWVTAGPHRSKTTLQQSDSL